MAKRRRRRRNETTVAFVAAGVVIVAAAVISVVAIIASGNGAVNSSSDEAAVAAPTTSVTATSSASTVTVTSEESSSGYVSSDEDVVSDHRLANGDYIEYTKSGVQELDEWYLLLTNRWNPVGADFEPESLVKAANCTNGDLDTRAYGAYLDMIEAADRDGISIYGVSLYRTYDYQKGLFERRVQSRMAEGLTREEAEAKVATGTAIPGTSEHQIGLAVDFNQVETSFENTKAGKWLRENCTDYGFILRYPADKTDITGIIYEPWHFRFVGVKHAKRMEELDMVLEEYVEYIKNGN